MTWTATDARAAYKPDPDDELEGPDSDYVSQSDYDPIIASLGEVLTKVEDQEYQGDTRVLLREGGRYGVVIIGWGSCSGCDALQASNTWQEIADLRNQIADSVTWRTTRDDTIRYIVERDWTGGFTRDEENATFVREAIKALLDGPSEQ